MTQFDGIHLMVTEINIQGKERNDKRKHKIRSGKADNAESKHPILAESSKLVAEL